MLMAEASLDQNDAIASLESAGGNLSVAVVMAKTKSTRSQAEEALAINKGVVARAVESLS